jgi:rhodanese-related sulfurtransferase
LKIIVKLKVFNLTELEDFLAADNSVLIDTRQPPLFADGFFEGSISLPYPFDWIINISNFFPNETRFAFVADETSDPATIFSFLKKNGISQVIGYFLANNLGVLKTSIQLDLVIAIETDEFVMDFIHDDKVMIVDVRGAIEYNNEHISGAQHLALDEMGDPANIALLPEFANIYLYCSDGNRSMTAASILKLHGLHNIRVVLADWDIIYAARGITFEKSAEQLN